MSRANCKDYRCNLHKICGKGPKEGCIFTNFDDGRGIIIEVRNNSCPMPRELIFSNVRVI